MDLDGHLKGFHALSKVLKPGGMLYLSVPIGPERIDFNANRVFAVQTLLDLSRADYELAGFSYVDDAGALHEDVAITPEQATDSFGCQYGCGIFEFRKRHNRP